MSVFGADVGRIVRRYRSCWDSGGILTRVERDRNFSKYLSILDESKCLRWVRTNGKQRRFRMETARKVHHHSGTADSSSPQAKSNADSGEIKQRPSRGLYIDIN